jgi:hypothetical protein
LSGFRRIFYLAMGFAIAQPILRTWEWAACKLGPHRSVDGTTAAAAISRLKKSADFLSADIAVFGRSHVEAPPFCGFQPP